MQSGCGKQLYDSVCGSEKYPSFRVANYNYNAMPNCYQPLSLEALDAAGILQVPDTPGLGLDGKGVLLGFLDSGIDYDASGVFG